MPDSREPAQDDLFQAGLQVRRDVLGDEYVNKAVKKQSHFTQPLQEIVTKAAWGMVWTRPGLTRAQRSMLNIALLAALNRPDEFALHLRGAIRNGVTKTEVQEILLHVSMYCGMPAAVSSFKIADQVLKDMEDVPERKSKL
ncbi:4-carboxymuconolactone decarboxylase family protein [Penicillium sp. DV-2018c]|nr:4-carboxymuconolactone decarboxylase family protein [Penicillium sp. DV-2018c]KAJ5560762.1 4-carboxymuconolactone decarboxylase family protein [Penicillium sp. DV-2018c]